MKTKHPFIILFLFIAMTGLVSCTNDDNSIDPVVTGNTLKEGSWKITYFWDKDHDETSDFSDYDIVFNEDGTVTASGGTDTITGTWSTGTDDSQPKLNLFFSASPFDELTEDWHIIEQSDVLIKTEHVSGGDGMTEFLNLEKI